LSKAWRRQIEQRKATVEPAFSPRRDSLDPVAVIGLGPVARALAERLLRLADDRLALLRGLAGEHLIMVLGEASALPWVDGVTYLGRDVQAPQLLLPTTLAPAVALAIFERAMARHAAGRPGPWAVLAAPPLLVSVADARPIERDHVGHWLGAP
jgi:MoxR-vWA-beta-propeller ternary system domain bpX5